MIKIKDPKKLVKFNEIIIIYFFLDDGDRKSDWVENRCHFQRRCQIIENNISFVFMESHRVKVKNLIKQWNKTM